MKIPYVFYYFVFTFFLISCATYTPQYRNPNPDSQNITNKDIEKTIYLFGDGGNADLGQSTPALIAFKKYLKLNPSTTNMALFLGDNIYPSGMVSKKNKKRELAEHRLNVQYESVKNGVKDVFFIPGNHDWYNNGLQSLSQEQEYLKKISKNKNIFLPKDGCPLESIEISENMQLVILDTQWYLEDWNQHPTINKDCSINTREKFFQEIEGELHKNQNKTILLAMHHPMFTNGIHGGKYALKNHLYPTQSNFPLPIFSSLIAQIRSQGGISKQDRYNEKYNELMQRLSVIVTNTEQVILLSGHEHNLQYIEDGNIKQIVSGATSKESSGALGKNGLFSYGGFGFAVLDIFKDGSSKVKFYGIEGENTPKLLFEHKVNTSKIAYKEPLFPNNFPKTIRSSVYDIERTDKSGFFKTIWGQRYRQVYGTKVEANVALLDTLYGGLTPVRAGGGHQTKSLRLVDKNGKNYNMRAIKKSAIQYLQSVVLKDSDIAKDFENTITEDLIYDFYTAAHPYAPFAIPKLADAAGVLYTTPILYYVPKQKALGQFNEDYGDELYMIVERPHGKYRGKEIFDYADNIRSTDELFEKILKSENNVLDEKAYIRARLFDMLIGDWDRHADQWRWAEYKGDDGVDIFVPIPRDRDQVFANFDGSFLEVLRSLVGASRQLQVYDSELKNTKWFNAAGMKLDRALLHNTSYEDWIKEAEYLQKNITDAIIEEAFLDVPKEVQEQTLEEIKTKLRGRRENMVKIAEEYYQVFSKLQVVTATNKDDIIEITRKLDGITNIKVYRNIKGVKKNLLSDKDFNKKETKEIWVYGLNDTDSFIVKGKAKNPILIRIIGGQGKDIYAIEEGKKIRVYDWKSLPNTIEQKGGARFRFTNDYDNNNYDIDKKITSSNTLLPRIGANPDDGFLIGVTNTYTLNGFQRNPFSQKHSVKGGYYFATNGFDLHYIGEFAKFLNSINLLVGAQYTSPTFARNFFGFGNETKNQEDALGLDFNRVRWRILAAEIGLKKNGNFGSSFQLKARGETVDIEITPDRFLSQNPIVGIEDRTYFLTLESAYTYKSVDNALNPTRGMLFDLVAGGTTNLEESKTFGYLKPRLGFYNAISTNRKLVLKTDVSAQILLGDDFEFYQAATLGGNTGLRAFRNERFTGKTSFLSSADLRYSFNSFKTGLLPLQVGVFAGYDVGRVWYRSENSELWHNSYGGGFWIVGADNISATFNAFNGADGVRLSFGLGVGF